MSLKITARVISQLGTELISSDDVAIFELVKNGFDAGASHVSVHFNYVIDQKIIRELESAIDSKALALKGKRLSKICSIIRDKLISLSDSPTYFCSLNKNEIEEFTSIISTYKHAELIKEKLRSLNYIEVIDFGSGMSKFDIEKYFLTIGTTHRKGQHEDFISKGTLYPNTNEIPVAGEKGIGRLSSMRLGKKLQIETWQANKREQYRLSINWRWFEENPESNPENHIIKTETVSRSESLESHGTRLIISDLNSDWSYDKSRSLSLQRLSKFIDPFTKPQKRRIKIRWNNEHIDLDTITKIFLNAAHNGMKGKVSFTEDSKFKLKINYWFNNFSDSDSQLKFERTYTSADFSGLSDNNLKMVGPFEFELYQYNRRNLSAIPGHADRNEFKKWLDNWSGGLMLYRDGLRVLPYGQHPDDWLELDQRALRAKGFRVNRIQVVGCVKISRPLNPLLQDQTNREGLQSNDAYLVFQELLRRIIDECFVSFYRNFSEKKITDDDFVPRVETIEGELESSIEEIVNAIELNDTKKIKSSVSKLKREIPKIKELVTDFESVAAKERLNQVEVVELAAKGLAAESIAHDVEAVLDNSISEAGIVLKQKSLSDRIRSTLSHLIIVLKSARVQIDSLKPGQSNRRLRRTDVNLNRIIEDLQKIYQPRFDRHGIHFKVKDYPPKGKLMVYAIESHLRQILENILRNSIYWVTDSKENRADSPASEISIFCDSRSKTVSIYDSGVGFAQEETEWVFTRFNSHRKDGHGLGLSIARELGDFNGVQISIDTKKKNYLDRHPGVILDFSNCVKKIGNT
ncbi:C4-dicarboxylate transport sensor protein DctB [Gimesia alba]|uniref:histidine kinase n=1 Tax=Gimesia alba TaxID=2527973 RepID=A0A517RF94_9PLAN|nr:sensor histidine kinase [Gimesia alba]QDT42549.1 C4-dicarboxylate transport sensor protein DctB [Gimesia alba]